MTIHVFNPSHDEALAAGDAHYTPSRAARSLAHDWAALPWVTADAGDGVLMDGETGIFALSRQGERLGREAFSEMWKTCSAIRPWGWDARLVWRLRQAGAPERLLPDGATLAAVRRLSSRETAVRLLPRLRRCLSPDGTGTLGESRWCESLGDVLHWAEAWQDVFVKSPWSCSGRGVMRMVWKTSPESAEIPDETAKNRVRKWLSAQGGVAVERTVHGGRDFALLFEATAAGEVRFAGFSFFKTDALGRYLSNVVLPQEVAAGGWQALDALCKNPEAFCENFSGIWGNLQAIQRDLQAICCTLDAEAIQAIARELAAEVERVRLLTGGRYAGSIGVDMLAVPEPGGGICPCVEVNFRRTMGWVAHEMALKGVKKVQLPSFLQKTFYLCAQ